MIFERLFIFIITHFFKFIINITGILIYIEVLTIMLIFMFSFSYILIN